MTHRARGRLAGVALRVLLSLLGIAILGGALFTILRRYPITHVEGPESTLLGRAYPIMGGPGRYGRGSYTHRLELEDGRKVLYTSGIVYGSGSCVAVRLRGTGSAIVVLAVRRTDQDCPDVHGGVR